MPWSGAGQQQQQGRADALFATGKRHFKKGQHAEAARAFTQALEMGHPDPHQVYSWRGVAHDFLEQHGAAFADHHKAIVTGRYPARFFNRGNKHMFFKRLVEAEADFRVVLQLDPENEHGCRDKAKSALARVEKKVKAQKQRGRAHQSGPTPTLAFSLSVIERRAPEQQFALVHEKAERGWWLPGGAVDAGQTLLEAAVRENEEEAGIRTELAGVLRVEFSRRKGRLRVIWLAQQAADDERPLKTVADSESRAACWVTNAECLRVAAGTATGPDGAPLEHCWLRGEEPRVWFGYMTRPEQQRYVAPVEFVRSVLAERRPGAAAVGSAGAEAAGKKQARDLYPTRTVVKVMVLHPATGRVIAGDVVPELPSAELGTGQKVMEAAKQLAASVQASAVKIIGLLSFHQRLDLTQPDPKEHCGTITVTFVAVCEASDSASLQSVGRLRAVGGEELAAEVQAVLSGAAPVHPLFMLVESERAEPATPEQVAEGVRLARRALSQGGA